MMSDNRPSCSCDDQHDAPLDEVEEDGHAWQAYIPAIISFVLLLGGLALKHLFNAAWFAGVTEFVWYAVAYLPVAWPVLKEAWRSLLEGALFTEFFLMSIATIGAFLIGQYPEGVAVMLFYAVGEAFQEAAVKRSKANIRALLDVRPKDAAVLKGERFEHVAPESVQIGDVVQVRAGEKIPLDGRLISEKAVLNTAALTGESTPASIVAGDQLLAGSINLQAVITLRVEKLFNDSSIARILELVQNATARKSKTELLIRRLAKIYTPVVVYLAIAILVLPWFFVADYVFSDWLYRALIFLVISCPCALVISIPLGYFGGLGAASRNGLLFKGASYIDQLTKVGTLVMDKTGTVTRGVFDIREVNVVADLSEADFMRLLMALEIKSTHPVAQAVMAYPIEGELVEAQQIQEIAGKGLQGQVSGQTILAGNSRLMAQFEVELPQQLNDIVESLILVAIDGRYAGHVIIADELKPDAQQSIDELHQLGIQRIVMLSGDKDSIVQKVAQQLGIDQAKGGLLPEDKLNEVEKIKAGSDQLVAFVGDGINDAPVLAASDVGIAMGAMGSDVAIETADIIIQTDQPSKIATGIRISQSTQRIIWQNIALALSVKGVVLILGAMGMATMWEAVFADVGVALLAILNAVRLQRMQWR